MIYAALSALAIFAIVAHYLIVSSERASKLIEDYRKMHFYLSSVGDFLIVNEFGPEDLTGIDDPIEFGVRLKGELRRWLETHKGDGAFTIAVDDRIVEFCKSGALIYIDRIKEVACTK